MRYNHSRMLSTKNKSLDKGGCQGNETNLREIICPKTILNYLNGEVKYQTQKEESRIFIRGKKEMGSRLELDWLYEQF